MIRSPRPCPLRGERCSTIRISASLRRLDCDAVDEASTNRSNGSGEYLWLIHYRYVTKVHVFVHATADVVTELVDLLSDVFQEGVARPAAYHHDSKGGDVV